MEAPRFNPRFLDMNRWELFRELRGLQTPDIFDEYTLNELQKICARMGCKKWTMLDKWDMSDVISERIKGMEAEIKYIKDNFL